MYHIDYDNLPPACRFFRLDQNGLEYLHNIRFFYLIDGVVWTMLLACFVTIQYQVPLFAAVPLDYLFQDVFQLSMSALNVARGWLLWTEKLFARAGQGWAANILMHISPQTGACVIKDLSLFFFNHDAISYGYESSVDPLAHKDNELLDMRHFSCEADDQIVQVGLVINRGPNRWSYKLFVYRINSGEWTVDHVSTMDGIIWAGLPHLTSRITI